MSLKLRPVLLAGILAISAFALAQDSKPAKSATTAVGTPAKAAPKSEKPLGINYGMDVRFRSDNLNNFSDFTNAANDEQRMIHPRIRVFATFNLGKYVDLGIREGSEPYKKLYVTNTATGKSVSAPLGFNQIWVDNAYLNFKKLPGLKNTTLKVGRFDFNEGEAWFFMQGAQAPGPRIGFMDGFVMSHTHGKQAFDLIGTLNSRIDDHFPVINQHYKATPGITANPGPDLMNDLGDLGAVILYYKNRQLKNSDIDGYFSYNRQYNMLPVQYNDVTKYTAAGYSNIQFQPDRYWNAFGGRLVQRLPQHFIVHANYTEQIGTQSAMSSATHPLFYQTVAGKNVSYNYPQVDIRARGADAFVTKYFQVKTKPYVGVVWAYMSGSDPKKPTVDGNFIPGFAQWARTSHFGPFMEEGYPLAGPFGDADTNFAVKEIGPTPAYNTNLKTINFRAGFTPFQGKVRFIQAAVEYHHTDAPHPFMGNAAHYNQSPAANATWQQLLTPIIGASTVAPGLTCSPNSGLTTNCNYNGGALHRFDAYTMEVRFKASNNLNAYMWWDHYVLGNFYNANWRVTPYTGATAVTAARNSANFVRMEVAYRFNGFQAYKTPKK